MSKEMDQIRQVVLNKQRELDIAARNKQSEEARIQLERENQQRQNDYEKKLRSDENKRKIESAGIARLFEEIKDSGIVKAKDAQYGWVARYKESFFSGKRIKIGEDLVIIHDYEPAVIEWGDENASISLIYNIDRQTNDDDETIYYRDDHLTFFLLKNGEIGYTGRYTVYHRGYPEIDSIQGKIEKPSDIPQIIAKQISETLKAKTID